MQHWTDFFHCRVREIYSLDIDQRVHYFIHFSYIKEKLKPFIQNEYQLIYLCHLFAPFMQRLDQERPRVGYELTTLLYELLEQVDKKQSATTLKYMDPICDLL